MSTIADVTGRRVRFGVLMWVSALALLAGGCRIHTTRIELDAASRLRCPTKDIRVSYHRNGYEVRVTGCGKTAVYVWDNHRDTYREIESELLKRATFEMECPVSKLKTFVLGNWQVRGVAGCGKRWVYVFQRHSTVWLANSSSKWVRRSSAQARPGR